MSQPSGHRSVFLGAVDDPRLAFTRAAEFSAHRAHLRDLTDPWAEAGLAVTPQPEPVQWVIQVRPIGQTFGIFAERY